ncbi:TetR/AcrR family transcriptional regulator [Actinophytocola sp.]|uniref:TetR/AcrR family transcriptional regulator n=1 Tax=Actinophytocola sp. TaxID=1872138 RepID=UPI002EDA400A
MGHREQLLAAARQLLEDKGYAHITARDLVAASGTNLASIGYHFGSKAGLLNAALGMVLEEWTTQLATAAMADPDASPIERAHLTWAAHLDSLSGRRALLVSFVEALAQADRDPQLRDQLAGMYATTRRRVASLVAAALGDEVAPEDPRCTAVASWVMAVCDGLSMQWMLDPASVPAGEHLLRGLADLRAISEER